MKRIASSNRTAAELHEAHILGHEPRITPLAVDGLSTELLELVAQMISVNSAIQAREQHKLVNLMEDHDAGASASAMAAHFAELPEMMLTMLRHPELFSRLTAVGLQLFTRAALSARDRELIVLRVGWLCQAPYEWGEHVHIAKSVGVTSEEIERITSGSNASGWNERDQALLRAVEELDEGAMISDATWAVLTTFLDERQLIELPIVVGQYQTTAYYQNSLRLRLHPGNLGLRAR